MDEDTLRPDMSFSPNGFQRSTKGASKQRRDLINMEIDNLKDLLPLPESVRQRLFQLQVMSMVCIFIRKDRYLPHSDESGYPQAAFYPRPQPPLNRYLRICDPCKAMRGFLLMVTRQGKLLYISDNATDYLGHSVEEMMSQGDSLYDLVDNRDHATVQSELLSGPPSISLHQAFPRDKVFICRMNLSRTAKRQLQYHKFILVHGRYLHPAEYYQALMSLTGPGLFVHPVFAAFCQPLITPENAEALASGNTTVFSSAHTMNMNFAHIDEIGTQHLGYSRKELVGKSWYRLVHPHDLPEVSFKHKLLVEDKETSCILLVRLQSGDGGWIWLHTVLAVREGLSRPSDSPMTDQVVLATYQMLSDMEAATLQANSWIYALPQRYSDPGLSTFFHMGGSGMSNVSSSPGLVECEDRKPKRKYQRSSSVNRLPEKIEPRHRHSVADGFHPDSLTPPDLSDPFHSIRVEIPRPPKPLPPTLSLPTLLTPENSPASSTSAPSHKIRPKGLSDGLPVIEAGSLEAYLRHVESEDLSADPLSSNKDPLLTDTLSGAVVGGGVELSPPLMTREQLLATAFPARLDALDLPKLTPAPGTSVSLDLDVPVGRTNSMPRVLGGTSCFYETSSDLESEGLKFMGSPQRRLSTTWSGAY